MKCEGNGQGGRGITVDNHQPVRVWQGQTYGLIAPGVEMVDILSFNLTQLEKEVGGFALLKMVHFLSS